MYFLCVFVPLWLFVRSQVFAQFLCKFFAEAKVGADAFGIDVVVVDTCGHDGDPAERFREMDGDSPRDRFFLVRRDSENRARSGPFPRTFLRRHRLSQHDNTDVRTLPSADGHDKILPHHLDPSFEVALTRIIIHPTHGTVHTNSRPHRYDRHCMASGSKVSRFETTAVRVGDVRIGGGAPVVVQSMTNTDTSDPPRTADQVKELADAGAELVRVTVNDGLAAAAVPEIRQRLDDSGCNIPLVGDFHFNGHLLLGQHPECAQILDKYRINPGNVGKGAGAGENFTEICSIARDLDKAVRIGVNGGSLDPDLVTVQMRENANAAAPRKSSEVLRDCMVISALRSTEAALECGLGADRIVISCKLSSPTELIAVYRALATQTRQPLHLGLTEAGMGSRGLVWSAAAMAVLLEEGIGDTIRVSLTPRPGESRTAEVEAAREILQSLGLRSFSPTVISCPGCGRTTSTVFQELTQHIEHHVKLRMNHWRERYPGVENITIAVMGCVVNGPGESRRADIGISLPGTGEEPRCPVFLDGARVSVLAGTAHEIATEFAAVVDDYVAKRFTKECGP